MVKYRVKTIKKDEKNLRQMKKGIYFNEKNIDYRR